MAVVLVALIDWPLALRPSLAGPAGPAALAASVVQLQVRVDRSSPGSSWTHLSRVVRGERWVTAHRAQQHAGRPRERTLLAYHPCAVALGPPWSTAPVCTKFNKQ
eukprot:SAG31_NODE_152_length_22216_cov_16.550029_5_plen_105_part_00